MLIAKFPYKREKLNNLDYVIIIIQKYHKYRIE